MKPVIALVGRPNVGKSTLFNRLTRSHTALVADVPGVTRDRLYGEGRIGDRPYLAIDTGGIGEAALAAHRDDLAALVFRQTEQAIAEADAVLFVTDARAGLTGSDREIATRLRQCGKPTWLVVNKSEGLDPDVATAEFHALGIGQPLAISAGHGEGVTGLMEAVLTGFPQPEAEQALTDVPRIAVIGRPNAGKSTLVNRLLGEERVLVSDEAGTTRDAIHVPLAYQGRDYVLIDTAGVRRRHRVQEEVEKHSVIRTLRAIDEANVAVLVLDAVAGVSDQDANLAGYTLEQGRAVVVAMNKWDALDAGQREWAARELERKLPFLGFARVHYISAKTGDGVLGLLRSSDEAFAAAGRSMPTSRLNRVLEQAVSAHSPPVSKGRRIRPKFAHQAGRHPPVIVVHGNQVSSLSEAYRRYLASTFRKAFRLVGTPLRIVCQNADNPYDQVKSLRRGTKTRQRGKKRTQKKR